MLASGPLAAAHGCAEDGVEREALPALEIWFDGCTRVSEPGPQCLIASTATLTVGLEGIGEAAAEWVLTTDHRTAEMTFEALASRSVGRILVQATERELRLADAEQRTRWSLPLAPVATSTALAAAEEALRQGDLTEAKRRIKGFRPTRPALQAEKLRFEGRLSWRTGGPETAELRRQAAAAAHAAGLVSLAVEERLAAGHAHLFLEGQWKEGMRDLETARRWLRPSFRRGSILTSELEGQLALAVGNRRRAVRAFAAMRTQADLLGNGRLSFAATLLEARSLRAMGQPEAAAERLLTVPASTFDAACPRALWLNHMGWSQLMAREMGSAPDPALRALLEDARALHEGRCRNRVLAGHDLLNLALLELQAGQPALAEGHLDAFDALELEARTRVGLWRLELEGRIRLAQGRPRQAERVFASMEALAEALASPDGRWRAALGRGRAAVARGALKAALAAYDETERRLDTASAAIALADDPGLFLASRAAAHREHLTLLHRLDRSRELVRVARRSRRRFLAQLDESARLERLSPDQRLAWAEARSRVRARRSELDTLVETSWTLPKKELPKYLRTRKAAERALEAALDEAYRWLRGPTELPTLSEDATLLGFAEAADGWLGFAQRSGESPLVRRVQVPTQTASPEARSDALLEPFREILTGARRVRVLASGALLNVDIHSLPFEGGRLLDHAEVVYALDLPPRPVSDTARTALVVADPTGDLSGARAEVEAVSERLRGQGWTVQALVGGNALARSVGEALAASNVFHLAGHAKAVDEGGGLRSAIELADDVQLTAGDILGLGHVPPEVFLSGCETAVTPERSVLELGLAQAFVLSGAHTVIASSRPVDDRLAYQLATRTYAEKGNLLAGFAEAQRALFRTAPERDWAAFRAVVP